MKNLVIAQRNNDLKVLNFHDGTRFGKGTYRVITKCQAGFMTSSDREYNSPYEAFRSYKLKHLHSIAYVSDGGYALTLYARNGKKVWINSQILSELTVGDINQELSNTALYNQFQYSAVNAKSWADKAYVMNEEKEIAA